MRTINEQASKRTTIWSGQYRLPGVSSLPDADRNRFDPIRFGTIVKDMCGGESVRSFAEKIGVSPSYISKCTNFKLVSPPTKKTLFKLSNATPERPVDLSDLTEAAGYTALQGHWISIPDSNFYHRSVSFSTALADYYGSDILAASCELQKALMTHGVDGDLEARVHRKEGYFEITDLETKQIYVGIPAFCNDPAGEIAVFFAMTQKYIALTEVENSREKVFYIITDKKAIFDNCVRLQQARESRASIVVYTEDHEGFTQETLLQGSGGTKMSLID